MKTRVLGILSIALMVGVVNSQVPVPVPAPMLVPAPIPVPPPALIPVDINTMVGKDVIVSFIPLSAVSSGIGGLFPCAVAATVTSSQSSTSTAPASSSSSSSVSSQPIIPFQTVEALQSAITSHMNTLQQMVAKAASLPPLPGLAAAAKNAGANPTSTDSATASAMPSVRMTPFSIGSFSG
jgi:hypothetical protein